MKIPWQNCGYCDEYFSGLVIEGVRVLTDECGQGLEGKEVAECHRRYERSTKEFTENE